MDPSKLSQASHNITNWINTNLNPDDRIQDIKNSFSTLSTNVKNKLALLPRNETSKNEGSNSKASTKYPSLKALLPPQISANLKDLKETVSQNFVAKEIAKALKNVFPHKEITGSNDFERRTYHKSNDVRALTPEVNKFNESLKNEKGDKGLIATHYKTSLAEINSNIAIGVRDRYEAHKQIAENGEYSKTPDELKDEIDELTDAINNLNSKPNLNKEELSQLKSVQSQLKSLQLEENIRSLSQEDKEKFLSLNPEEVKALQIYTADDAYRHINYVLDGNKWNLETFLSDKKLHRDDPAHLAEAAKAAEQTIEVTASALNKLPGYGKSVYKSVRMTPDKVEVYRNAHSRGNESANGVGMLSNKFFSTTKSKEQAERFDETSSKTLDDGTPLTKVIYQIDPTDGKKLTGADITFLSAKDGEEEVLFNYGSVFISTGIEEMPETVNENGVKQEAYILIKFREVPPSSIK